MRDLEVVHNTVVGGTFCMRLTDWGGREGMVLANNAAYCPGETALRFATGSSGVAMAGNVIMGSVEGASSGWVDGAGIAADFTDYDGLDVWPTAGSALLGAAVDDHAVELDFNGTTRSSPHHAGAYHRTGDTNPGWTLQEGFKEETAPPPDAAEEADVVDAVEPGPDAAADVPADLPADSAADPLADPGGDTAADAPADPSGEEPDDSSDKGCGCSIVL